MSVPSNLLWCPGAKRMAPSAPGGAPEAGAPKAVWHTTEGSTVAGAVATLRHSGVEPHLVWNPTTGEIVQLLPANQTARALENDGSRRTNRAGVCIQIEVVGYAKKPWTAGPCRGLGTIMTWLRALGVRDTWPMGSPLPYPKSYGANNGDRATWAKWQSTSGHYAHSQAPGNHHGDPGAIDIRKILAAGKPAPKPSRPAPAGAHRQVTVQRGQTLWKIAAAAGVSVAALQAANPGVNPRLLQPGQRLNIPAPAPKPSPKPTQAPAPKPTPTKTVTPKPAPVTPPKPATGTPAACSTYAPPAGIKSQAVTVIVCVK